MSMMTIPELEKVLDKCEACSEKLNPPCDKWNHNCMYKWACDETDTLRALAALAEAAHVVARMYGETLCQGNEGRTFLDTVDAVFPKETDE